MKTIWKYQLQFGENVLTMPVAAAIVNVAYQPVVETGSESADIVLNALQAPATMWAVVFSDAPLEERRFVLVGTGREVPDGTTYVGTACMPGALVWHVFEERREEER